MRDQLTLTASGSMANRMTRRRMLFVSMFIVAFVGLTTLMALTLAPGGYGWIDMLLLICFMITLPWTIIGFLNAAIGFLLMRFSADPVASVCPIDLGDKNKAITSKTALLSCVRDEDIAPLNRKLTAMLVDLERTKALDPFSLFILSDTSKSDIAAEEEAMVDALKLRWGNAIRITYRRRTDNTGFKAGNIMDFCDRWGSEFDFAVTLDADSVMSGEKLVEMVRAMEANPGLGILQSLAVGLPADSAFARVFQYGMRLGMRSYTLGSAW